MITGYVSQPEVVVETHFVDKHGDQRGSQDHVALIEVKQRDDNKGDGLLSIELRDFRKSGEILVLRFSLQQLQLAITSATITADRV